MGFADRQAAAKTTGGHAAGRRLTPEATAGVVSAFGAFLIWGLAPIYFKALPDVPVAEVVAHRVVWSLAFMALLLTVSRQWRAVRAAVGSRRTMATLACTTALISINWTLFIWAISVERVLEVSLGYFILPLVNVLFGMVFLGERLGRWQAAAVLLAGLGVLNLTIASGAPPWMGMTLAVSFAVYGLLRKTAPVDALVGLALETSVVAPLALGYLAWLAATGAGSFGGQGLGVSLLLLAAGPITAMPLILFTRGARRLKLSTVGVLQYVSPSIQFLLAVLWWDEPFTSAHLATYACIWLALVLYTWDATRRHAGRAA